PGHADPGIGRGSGLGSRDGRRAAGDHRGRRSRPAAGLPSLPQRRQQADRAGESQPARRHRQAERYGVHDPQPRMVHQSRGGGALAILSLLFCLRNSRSTLVVALSIPISIVSTFALLYVCGFTLNTMTLGGLALATGLIVDDAVVVLENIFRHIERDKKRPAEAAVSGTMEIASAVVASTLTVMVVFLPLMLLKGQSGHMFTQFALVVIFSIGVSLLDAMTVVPMLASRLIQGEAHHETAADGHRLNPLERAFVVAGRWLDALDNAYRNGLRWGIRHRVWVI